MINLLRYPRRLLGSSKFAREWNVMVEWLKHLGRGQDVTVSWPLYAQSTPTGIHIAWVDPRTVRLVELQDNLYTDVGSVEGKLCKPTGDLISPTDTVDVYASWVGGWHFKETKIYVWRWNEKWEAMTNGVYFDPGQAIDNISQGMTGTVRLSNMDEVEAVSEYSATVANRQTALWWSDTEQQWYCAGACG